MISANIQFHAKSFIGLCGSALISSYCAPLSWVAHGAISVAGQAFVHGVASLVNKCRRSTPKKRVLTDFNAVAKKIAELKKTNKVCLIIGRQPYEPLPEPKDGTIWVSLDESDCEDANTDPNRLHLKMNALDKASISRIKGLFHEVVVDYSTWKFFGFTDDDNKVAIETLIELLDPTDKDSTFISDFMNGGGLKYHERNDQLRIARDIEIQRRLQEEFFRRKVTNEGPISDDEVESIRDQVPQANPHTNVLTSGNYAFIDFLPSIQDIERMKTVNTIDMLRRLFKSVKFIKNGEHPYPNIHRRNPEPYYVLKGLKH